MKPKYGDKCRLVYTDTNSLLLEIERKDVYKDMEGNLDLNYPKDRSLYSSNNKKVLGKMKDEFGGRAIYEAIALRPKMYTILGEQENFKKAKGVKKIW